MVFTRKRFRLNLVLANLVLILRLLTEEIKQLLALFQALFFSKSLSLLK